MRRAAGTALLGSLASTAGCLGGSGGDTWDAGREGSLQPWLYDPASYREDVTDYVVGYWEPATFAASQDALRESAGRVQRYHAAAPENVEFTVELGGASDSGGLPYVLVSRGSFDAETVRDSLTAEFERVGTLGDRPLYGDGTDAFAVVADGELVFVRGLSRADAESYVTGSRSFASDDDRLASFFDTVGVGANAGFRLSTDDDGTPTLHGHAYRVDGGTTTARALRVPGVDEARGEELTSYLDQVQSSVDRLRSASVEYDAERVLLDLKFATAQAPFGVDPLSNFGLR
ncbi:hypothetical protein [Haloarchaeobius iranensis]|uniref:Uncharacterized protein n=1 Tax=Haloarchaeobius iranensis TaxID=996166 RepID=A0A1G9TAE9_9EURY|nr:hypothetical protein [Haloarchaeobius iranensis]SDM44634.1 hypothetical protein SAMN05192554_102233 [Haloarchaeobius iranensis]